MLGHNQLSFVTIPLNFPTVSPQYPGVLHKVTKSIAQFMHAELRSTSNIRMHACTGVCPLHNHVSH